MENIFGKKILRKIFGRKILRKQFEKKKTLENNFGQKILGKNFETNFGKKIKKKNFRKKFWQISVAEIPTVLVENQITTLSVVKIAIKYSPCIFNILRQTGNS